MCTRALDPPAATRRGGFGVTENWMEKRAEQQEAAEQGRSPGTYVDGAGRLRFFGAPHVETEIERFARERRENAEMKE